MSHSAFKSPAVLVLATLLLIALQAGTLAAQTTVFLNEIHYDNDGTDTGEAIEIAGPAGTDLTGWSVVLYNGATGATYDTVALTALPGASGCGFLTLGFDPNGIQNGAPDGIALVDDASAVRQFLSYEGTFTAADGPAAGMTSTDIGVSESASTPIGRSLQLGGMGTVAEDFTWQAALPSTFGAVNRNQACAGDNGDGTTIPEIQGAGAASPLEGQSVEIDDAVVTCVTSNGFFIQDSAGDGNTATSDGIFVFTGDEPGVAPGDQVDVAGEVQEYFDLTEITDPTVQVDASGLPLPPPIAFDAATPDPDPSSPPDLERFEGMRVRLATGVTVGPTDPFGDMWVAAGAGTGRKFRQPGIEFPGLPGLPVWDGNQEIFKIDPDGLGGPDADLFALTPVTAATGCLTYSFGAYELLPAAASYGTGPALPVAVRSREAGELTVGSLNLSRLFDDVDDPGGGDNGEVSEPDEYRDRLAKLSRYIRQVLRSPDVLSVQEAEKLGVLEDLAARIADDEAAVVYTPYLVEGNDVGGIDVGFLVRNTMRPDAVTQLGADEIFAFDGSLLHDRPPLLLEATHRASGRPLSVLAVHIRSLIGIEEPRTRQKRLDQAQSIARMVDDFQASQPDVPLVVAGDFNAFQFTDGYVDVVGQIRGDFDPDDNLLSGPDLVDPDLVDEVLRLPAADRYSFIFEGTSQVLDHALTSGAAAPLVSGFAFGRGNADAPSHLFTDAGTALRSSDHDGFVLYLVLDGPPCPSGLLLNDDRFCVEVVWRDFVGNTGVGRPVEFRSDDSGLLWFFAPANWEMLIKVLDGCAFNNRYWVFAAATTNVEYTLTVTEVATGRFARYFNPLGRAAPAITDTDAFDACP